jgi:hypothetical protein
MTNIHSYDDPAIIAGHGSLGLELASDASGRLDHVFISIGGGGFSAGVGAALKGLDPAVRIHGVETEGATTMTQALAAGKPVPLRPTSIAAHSARPSRPSAPWRPRASSWRTSSSCPISRPCARSSGCCRTGASCWSRRRPASSPPRSRKRTCSSRASALASCSAARMWRWRTSPLGGRSIGV